MLDNAGSVDQVRPLLPASAGVTVIITSRHELAGLSVRENARQLGLTPLAAEDATRLLQRLAEPEGDHDHPDRKVDHELRPYAQLADLCGQLPLALRIVGVRARLVEQRGGDLDDLVRQLLDVRTKLDVLGLAGDADTDVRAVFSWSYRALDPNAAELFRLFGLLSADAQPDIIASLWGRDLRTTQNTLEILVAAHLIEECRGRYGQHDLLRAYAAELVETIDGDSGRTTALGRLLNTYLAGVASAVDVIEPMDRSWVDIDEPPDTAPTFTEKAAAVGWLDAERPALLSLTATTGDLGRSYRRWLAGLFSRRLALTGHPRPAIELTETALRDAQAADDVEGQARAEQLLGILADHVGDLTAAAHHQGRALDLYRRLGRRMGEAACLNNLAGVDLLRGQLRESAECMAQSLAIVREFDSDYYVCAMLGNLGLIGVERGANDAPEQLRQALLLAEEGGFSQTEVEVRHSLGRYALRCDRPDEAARHAEAGLRVARPSGFVTLEGNSLELLAEVSRARGDLRTALDLHTAAIGIASRARDAVSLVEAQIGMAETQLAIRAGGPALAQLREALAISTARGMTAKSARAESLIARASRGLGDLDAERRHLARAHLLYAQTDYPMPSPAPIEEQAVAG